jgi:stage II sporulation protein D
MNNIKFLFPFILILIGSCAGVQKRHRLKAPPLIRVLLSEDLSTLSIHSKGAIFINNGKKIYRLKRGNLKVKSGKIYKEEEEIAKIGSSIKISFEKEYFEFNGKTYRGKAIIKNQAGKIKIINTLDIESYLLGVVPCEFGRKELEALKAGAVAARSYALFHLSPSRDYDVASTESDQVYGGKLEETKLAARACKETYGLICTYHNKPIDARYSSTCGGRTESARAVWGKDYPYLRSVSCPYCEISPHYRWRLKYNKKNFVKMVEQKLSAVLMKNVNPIRSIKIKKRDKSGRVSEIEVKTTRRRYTISGEQIRDILGLKSRWFNIRITGSNVIIDGRGYGHGVGLCAYGAIGMAKKGYNFQSILRYYYRGVSIKKVY